MKIVFATGNEGKMREVRQILRDIKIPVFSMKEEGIMSKPEETGSSFEENAIIKAKALFKKIGAGDVCVLADDSGLEVDALNKEPGIYSARYLGEEMPYSEKNKNILERMKDLPPQRRAARFVAAIAAVLPDGEIITTRGTIEGRIAFEQRGANGFGYDPIFYLPHLGVTTAELAPEEKNKISHRGRALEEMKKELKKRL